MPAPSSPATVKPRSHLPDTGEVPRVERPGFRLDSERDPGWRDRDAIDIATPPILQRMANSPALCLERREGCADCILRAGANAAAAGQTQPAARVDPAPDHDHHEYGRERRRAGAEGDDRQRAGCCRRGGAGGCSAQPSVLLAAGETRADQWGRRWHLRRTNPSAYGGRTRRFAVAAVCVPGRPCSLDARSRLAAATRLCGDVGHETPRRRVPLLDGSIREHAAPSLAHQATTRSDAGPMSTCSSATRGRHR
jgi:hypothetical protein